MTTLESVFTARNLTANRAVVNFEKRLSARGDFARKEFTDKLSLLYNDKLNYGYG